MSQKDRERRALRRMVTRAMAEAIGPEEVNWLQNPDGTIIVLPMSAYLWRGTLPSGEPFAFTTKTPTLEYAHYVDAVAEQIERGQRRSFFVEHTPECQALGVGCICTPKVVRHPGRRETSRAKTARETGRSAMGGGYQ